MSKMADNEMRENVKKDNIVYRVGFIASGVIIISALMDLAVSLKAGESVLGSALMIAGGVLMLYAFFDSKKKYLKKHTN